MSVQLQLNVSFVQKQSGVPFERNTGFIYTQGTHTVVLRTLRKSQKLTPNKKNQSDLIAKISSRSEDKKSPIRKNINSRKNFVPHGNLIPRNKGIEVYL